MSWLHKICQQKPMALPYMVRVKEKLNEHGGMRSIDRSMSDESARAEEDRLGEMEPLGAGAMGIAYTQESTGDAIKYTHDPGEVKAADYIYQAALKGQPITCTVQVISPPHLVQEWPTKIWALSLEKVKPLTRLEQKLISIVRRHDGPQNTQAIYASVKSLWEQTKSEPFPVVEANTILEQYTEMVSCLGSHDLDDVDAHGLNLGHTEDGRLVLLDLGNTWLG